MDNLKERTLSYISKVESTGGKVGSYICPYPNCKSLLKTTLPAKKGEVWDSAVVCYECGGVHYTVKTMAGVTANLMNVEDVV